MNKYERLNRSVRWGFLLLVFAIFTSIVIQDYTDVLPLGLFNMVRQPYKLLANMCLIVTSAIFAIFIAECWRDRQWRLATALRCGLFLLVASELLLGGLDRLFVSRNPQSSLGGPYYERKISGGTWVFLKKAHTGSPLGFRTDHPYKLVPDHRRILFLGDSYTEGSGRSSACNYPTVVETVLRYHLGDVEVMNAGVSGYGPAEALNLLRLLRQEGYRFEALVYNLFTENDFTDNLPNTDRRIVGGVIFRVPHSRFLRTFHPMNSYLFRYALVMSRMATFSSEEATQISLDSGSCIFSEERDHEVSLALRELIRERLAGSQRVSQSKRAQQEFINTIAAMKTEADKLHIPFIIVVFPDRVVADPELRLQLELDVEQMTLLNGLRSVVYQAFPNGPIIDVADTLRGHPGMYRRGDTHLSDLGNKIAGEYVGQKLSTLLLTTGFGLR